VTKVERHSSSTHPNEKGRSSWTINNGSELFDGVICTVGTCGNPKVIAFPDEDKFGGNILHSSQLDHLDDREVESKRLLIIGSGASGVEAAEFAVGRKASRTVVLARSVWSSRWTFAMLTFETGAEMINVGWTLLVARLRG
jgi:dimethylaniline monooxygenase (N-oxide forming)